MTSDNNGGSNNAGGSDNPGGSANTGSPGNSGGGLSDVIQSLSRPVAPSPRPPLLSLPAQVPSTTESGGTGPGGSNADLFPPGSGPSNGPGSLNSLASAHDSGVTVPIATMGTQIFSGSPNRETIVMADSTVLAGASAITLGGTKISLDTSRLVYGTNTVILSPSPAQVFTAAGHTITSSPNGVLVSGENIESGEPAITISGAAVSLGNGGLKIGSSTVQLSPAVILPPAPSQVFTV